MSKNLNCPFCNKSSVKHPCHDLYKCSSDLICPAGTGWYPLEIWNTRHVPEGVALVPVEATEKIRQAMYMAAHYDMSVVNPDEWSAVDKSYKAMINAAKNT